MGSSEHDALQRIVHAARHMLEINPAAAHATKSVISLPKFLHEKTLAHTLPDPQPITPTLLAHDISAMLSDRLSDVYLRRAKELKELYEKQMHVSLLSWMQSGYARGQDPHAEITALQSAFCHRYFEALRRTEDMLLAVCRRQSTMVASSRAQLRLEDKEEGQDKPSFKKVRSIE